MVEKYYTPKQVAEILQVHPYTILKWIREGRLPALKFGRVYRTTETELTKFLGSTRSHQNEVSTQSRISTETSIMQMHNKEIEQQIMESQKAVPDRREDRQEEEQFYILEPPSLT